MQRAVGVPEQLRIWAIDENYNEVVVSSNFMRSYQVVVSRNMEKTKMPIEIKQLIKKVNELSIENKMENRRKLAIESMLDRKESEAKALEAKSEFVPLPKEYKDKLIKDLGG